MKSYDGEFQELRGFLEPPPEAESPPPDPTTPPPVEVGKYRLLREIGRGGMGIVYEAEDTELRRRVALKVLREPQADREMIRRMQREAVIAAQLKHPHIVAIHDVGMSGDAAGEHTYYIAMDLVEGETLADLMAKGRPPLQDLLRILEETARAAAYAHDQGIIHRDLKPSNVLVDREGRALLTDFGLARAEAFASQLTRSSELLGTPRYMAPEVVAGKAKWVDGRTDVYAMGVILYEMLAGRPPHSATTPARLYEQILTNDPVPPSRFGKSVDPALEAICLKAIEKNRAHRYTTAREFAEDLRNFRAGEPIRAKRVPSWHRLARKAMRSRGLRIAGVAALVLLVVAGGAFSWAQVRNQRLNRRRHEALYRLGTIWSTIIERKNEMRQGRIDPVRGRRELAEAVQSLDAHVQEWPNEPQGYYVRARVKMYLDDSIGAQQDLQTALARHPGFRPGWILLGIVKMSEYQRKSRGVPRERDRRMAEMDLLARQASEAFAHAGDPADMQKEYERWSLTWTREDRVMIQVGRVALLHVENRLDEAERLLAESYQEFQSEEFIYWICVYLSNGGDPAQLDRWTNRFVKSAPGYEEAHFMRGEALRQAKDYAAAIESFGNAVRIRPDCADGYYNRGAVKEVVGDLDGALADYDHAITLNQDQPEFYNNRGAVYLGRKEYRKALEDLDRAVALDPDYAGAYHNRATAKAALGRDQEALDDCDRALELREDYSDGYVGRAILKKKMGDLAGSLGDCTRAIELQSDNARAYNHRGVTHHAMGDSDKAVADFSRAIELKKDYAEAYSNRGCVRFEKGEYDAAIEDLTRAIRIDETAANSWSNRGAARLKKGDLPGALADLDRAVQLGSNDANTYFNRGSARRERRDYEGAIADYDRAIALENHGATAYFWRAEAEAALERYDAAIADYDRGLRLKGDDHDAYHSRGKAKVKKGDPASAIVDFDLALKMEKNCPYALYDRATAKRSLGDRHGAVEDLRKALRLAAADWADRAAAERLLDELEKP